ncbi:hypothetical protein ACFQV2_32045 [Actinokineospora soli]|uniref:Protein kinase domain-containing protein n=1 Tax=Actinokineospora soli TaxID=1048753 RepID=A0ABW2TX70_9PSEU
MGEVVGAVRGDGVPAEVAVKLLRRDLAARPGTAPRLRDLVAEVHGVGGPDLVAVWDWFRDGEVVGLVMDLAPGSPCAGGWPSTAPCRPRGSPRPGRGSPPRWPCCTRAGSPTWPSNRRTCWSTGAGCG